MVRNGWLSRFGISISRFLIKKLRGRARAETWSLKYFIHYLLLNIGIILYLEGIDEDVRNITDKEPRKDKLYLAEIYPSCNNSFVSL